MSRWRQVFVFRGLQVAALRLTGLIININCHYQRSSLFVGYLFFVLQAGMKKAEEKGANLKHSYMFWLPLIAVLREGIETVIFLAGTSSQYEVRWRFVIHFRLLFLLPVHTVLIYCTTVPLKTRAVYRVRYHTSTKSIQ